MSEPPFSVVRAQHRVMGQQIRLRFNDVIELRLTPAEASSLSLALVAVSRGISPEREIYMSPIASDEAFIGKVQENGMLIECRDTTFNLDWSATNALATALARAIG